MRSDQQPRIPGSGTLTILLLVLVAVFVVTFDRVLGCLGLGS
jgi:hypothetical protein